MARHFADHRDLVGKAVFERVGAAYAVELLPRHHALRCDLLLA